MLRALTLYNLPTRGHTATSLLETHIWTKELIQAELGRT